MADQTLKDLTDSNQSLASDPDVCAWVSANAGTGKTTVLVNRVLRLLLHRDAATGDYTRPETILCLTYTKAAAAEMENRLFKILSAWAVTGAEDLKAELAKLTGRDASDDDMVRARQLFAVTLDTKGGLKIHTIHAFCERLLHRFPIEAGVQADFDVLGDAERLALRDEAIDHVLVRAAADPGGPLGDALTEVAAATGEDRFREIVDVVLGKQEHIRAMHALSAGPHALGDGEAQALRQLFGAGDTLDEEQVMEEMAGVLNDAEIAGIVAALRTGSSRDQGAATALEKVAGRTDLLFRTAGLKGVFLRVDGRTPRSPDTLCTKAVRESFPEAAEKLVEAHGRFCALLETWAALHIASSTGALLTLADAIIGEYERAKASRAALDYDDLIQKTARLLVSSGSAQWVLYKLDWGLDHILVDEAQDTSPVQWRVIGALAEEFFSGAGARENARTIFGVGDEKQSIYSFQGADPASFGAHGRAFRTRASDAGRAWKDMPLTVSFRSTQPVLETVDAVFEGETAGDGVVWNDDAVSHQAIRAGEAGLVELWDIEEPDEVTPVHAMEPHEARAAERHAQDKLAQRIAGTIRRWLDDKEPLKARDRAIRPGDILILVRQRDAFVQKLIRALKSNDIPVAGSDRMKLTEQLAVMDLMAVADFVLLPEDDLTLATVLKSPLVGLDDDHLFELAHGRKGSLWSALRGKTGERPEYVAAALRLSGWLDRADAQPPYEFFAGLLEENGMELRLALIGRLGADAGDAIDEFLNLALDHEREEHPSLQGFLAWMRSFEAEVKRDMEQGRDEVRIMTVHGAKGLEANVVIMPDTCRVPGLGSRARLYEIERDTPPGTQDHLVWVPSDVMEIEAISVAKEALKDDERREYHRLLYVAMTRAMDRLYVCGWKGQRKTPDDCWYNLVRAGLEPLAVKATGALGDPVLRYEDTGDAKARARADELDTVSAAIALPDWARRNAAEERPAALPLRPSSLPGEAGESEALGEQDLIPPLERPNPDRFLRGNIIHALLQHLPDVAPDLWEEKAAGYVAARGRQLDGSRREEIVAETLAVLNDSAFAPLFGAGSSAEVAIVARFETGVGSLELNGIVDRLIELDDEVLIVDYKTNRPPPKIQDDVAPLYIRQLAAYRAALGRIYPEKTMRAALLWTDGPTLMKIDNARLEEAAAILDIA